MDKRKYKTCYICELNATCLCFICQNYFCDKCFKCIHDLMKNKEHKKELIDPYISFDLKCNVHPDQINSLFCLEDKGKTFY